MFEEIWVYNKAKAVPVHIPKQRESAVSLSKGRVSGDS